MIKKIIKENYSYLLTIILIIVLSLIVKYTNLYNYVFTFDNKVLDYIKTIRTNNLTNIFKIFTFFGDIYIPLLIIVCTLVVKKKKTSFTLAVNYALSGALALFVKLLIFRPRPLEPLIRVPDKWSFPSGHTLTAIAFYLMLTYLAVNNRSSKIIIMPLMLIFTLLIGFSRIYLGVHYFSDVIGAICLTIPLLLMNINIYEKHIKEAKI